MNHHVSNREKRSPQDIKMNLRNLCLSSITINLGWYYSRNSSKTVRYIFEKSRWLTHFRVINTHQHRNILEEHTYRTHFHTQLPIGILIDILNLTNAQLFKLLEICTKMPLPWKSSDFKKGPIFKRNASRVWKCKTRWEIIHYRYPV
jgi:hypothetical protein